MLFGLFAGVYDFARKRRARRRARHTADRAVSAQSGDGIDFQ
ncbi:MAG: hypothetical protein JNJ50_23335 [Acidobacteria bacterium]|nr:hypothetical protein [Acidobacteriota bacterium]